MSRLRMRKTLARVMGMATKAQREGWSDQRLVEEMEHRSKTHPMVARRDLFAWAGVSLALGACVRLRTPDVSPSSTLKGQGTFGGSSSGPRIIVLGSGFAGMTAAYELYKKGTACSIFESRDRVGGRVFTKRGFNQDGMFIELGAEFVDSVHSDLIGLARELNVEVEDYIQPISGLEGEVYLFNQKVIDSGKFLGEFKKLAALVIEDTQKIRSDRQIVTPTAGRPGPSPWLDQISLADYLDSKQKLGISAEFIDLINVMYLGMMGLETSDQNTYNLLTLMDPYSAEMALYGDSDESKRVKGGNGILVDALAQSVGRHSPIHLGHRLVAIKDTGQHFVLTFERTGKSPLEVKADLVINTLPIPVLGEIDGMTSLNLTPAKQAAIKALGYATNAKFTIGFKERKWRNSGNIVPPNYGTVWTNGLFPEVRDSSNHQKGRSGIILNYLGGEVGRNIPPNLVGKTLDHLESMYPGIRSLYDGHTNLQHWTSDPFAKGSYICPKPGHYESMGGFEDPVELGGRMIFAGDSFSKDFGGYMNGAIETGKKAAMLVTQGVRKKIEVY